MRIIRPSALLIAGTVALFGATTAFGDTSTEPAANNSPAAPQATQQTGTPAENKSDGIAPAHSRGFSFSFGETDKPLTPEDPQEKIEKARPLHEQAMELLKNGKTDQAAAIEKQAIEAAPNYWLPHAGMAYILNKQHRSPFEALKEASESVKTRHPAVADSNMARLFETIHMFQPAAIEFKKALKAEPDAWQNNLGLADCEIVQGQSTKADKALSQISENALKDFDCLAAASSRYLEIPNYDKAKELLNKALDLAPNQQDKQNAIDLLYSAAVKSDDLPLITKLQPQISQEFTKDQTALVFTGKVRLCNSPADIDGVLSEAAAIESKAPEEVFYAIGMEVEKKADADAAARREWLSKADQAFKNASIRNSELRYQLAVASVADQRKDQAGVIKALQDIKDSIPQDTPQTLKPEEIEPLELHKAVAAFQKQNLVRAYVVHKADELQGNPYQTTAKTLRIKLLKPSCTCHARAIGTALGQEPGAICSYVSHDENPIVTIVYDSKKMTAAKLLSSTVMTSLKEPFEQLPSEPVATLTQLDSVIISHDQNKPVQPPSLKVSLDLPSEKAGQVAETSPPPVR